MNNILFLEEAIKRDKNALEEYLRQEGKSRKEIDEALKQVDIFTDLGAFALSRLENDPRGFEVANGFLDVTLPTRATHLSAGYDLYAHHDGVIEPMETEIFHTGVKAYMLPDEVLKVYARSSVSIDYHLMLANSVGIIDADYYGNETNDGEIMVALTNLGYTDVKIEKGDRIAQCIFQKYLTASVETGATKKRTGGIGSTGQK